MFTLAIEREKYLRSLKKFINNGEKGRWVLIKGYQVIGFYESYHDAKQTVIDKNINPPVLIRQVIPMDNEPVYVLGGIARVQKNSLFNIFRS